MKDTCIFKDCPIAKRLKVKKPEECFNFIEGWWTPQGKKEPTIIKDCSPKRNFLMIQDLFNRLIGLQQSQDQMRNEYSKDQMVINLLSKNIEMSFDKLINNTQNPKRITVLKPINSEEEKE